MLPEFCFIVPNKTAPDMGSGFVLRTKEPFELGRVIKVQASPFAESEYKNQFKPLILSRIDGYSIFIVYAGQLFGNKVRVRGANWESELQIIFDKMAQYFYEEKILNNQGYYKRFKLL